MAHLLVRNQQAEKRYTLGGCLHSYIRPGAGNSFYETSIFQFAYGSSYDDAGGPKLPHKGCLAWESLSRFAFACEDIPREQV